MKLFQKNKLSAYDAIYEAQKIALAPLVFQAARSLRDLGILEQLRLAGFRGSMPQTIASALELSLYGVETLLESGLSGGIVDRLEDGAYQLSKVGFYLLQDEMTRVNMDFTQQVCYQGAYFLDEAIAQQKPVGLKVFGEQWDTLYEALPHLPERVQASWYAFDHYYSDSAYPEVLPILFPDSSATYSLMDIGTNIGRFALLAAGYNDQVTITLVDLPDQLANAVANVEAAGYGDRVSPLAMDLLNPADEFPPGFDVYWMSQFLSCFGSDEIVSILRRIVPAMGPNSRLYILETCWDRQQHEAARYVLMNTSLYFCAMASGNSKMYDSGELLKLVEKAGLRCVGITDGLGLCHSLFECVSATK